ncbi:MAG: hypothetical protein N2C14_17140, partial [Planctomycetales bacterium]
MSQSFDPYYKWLGVPPKEQPANHYRLLSIQVFEPDPDVIEQAADRQMAHVQTHRSGKYSELSQKLLNELSRAKLCLLNAKQKAAYDQELRAKKKSSNRPKPKTRAAAAPAAVVATPAAAGDFPNFGDESHSSPSNRHSRGKSKGGNNQVMVIGGIGGGVALFLLVIGVFLLGGGTNENPENVADASTSDANADVSNADDPIKTPVVENKPPQPLELPPSAKDVVQKLEQLKTIFPPGHRKNYAARGYAGTYEAARKKYQRREISWDRFDSELKNLDRQVSQAIAQAQVAASKPNVEIETKPTVSIEIKPGTVDKPPRIAQKPPRVEKKPPRTTETQPHTTKDPFAEQALRTRRRTGGGGRFADFARSIQSDLHSADAPENAPAGTPPAPKIIEPAKKADVPPESPRAVAL